MPLDRQQKKIFIAEKLEIYIPDGATEEGGPALRHSHDHVCGEDGLCDTALCKDPFGGVDTHARSAENDAQKPELKADIIEKPANEVWGEATQILTSCEDPSAADGSGPALHSSPLDQGGGGALRGPLLDGGGGLHRVPEAVGGHALRAHLLDGGGGDHGTS